MVDQEEIHKKCFSDDPEERIEALEQLKSNFSLMSDKKQAWYDLVWLTHDNDENISESAADFLSYAFPYVPDKQQAWNDLYNSTAGVSLYVSETAAEALGYAFPYVPDKQQAWNDLISLTSEDDIFVKAKAAKALGCSFSFLPDKQKEFSHVLDKQQAWNELHKLIDDKDAYVRESAAQAIGSGFSSLPDKQEAFNDLIKLANDPYSSAAIAIGSAFVHMSETQKQQALSVLLKLINIQERSLRGEAAIALGSIFSVLLDKQMVLYNLKKMTTDKDSDVRAKAYYSLGKIYIIKATGAENEEDYKMLLEKAISFFTKSSMESKYSRPSQFCLPFYRSFYTIIFQRQKANEEIERYLKDVKLAIKFSSSKSKKLLFEAVNNLADALKEVQNLENLDLQTKKDELSLYRKYCENAAELIKNTEESAPYATFALRRGLPILDRNLKELLEEIQEKAKIACRESKGTATQEIACIVNSKIQERQISDLLELEQFLEDMAYSLKRKIINIPENEYLLDKIELMKNEKNTGKKLRILSFVIENLPTIRVVPEQVLDQKLDQKLQKFDSILGEIVYIKDKLSCIRFDISKIKLNSADVVSDLETMKEELEKLSKIEGLNTLSIEKLDSTQTNKLNGSKNNILECLDEIKILIGALPKNDDTKEILDKLNKLKQSDLDILLQRSSGIATLVSFFAMFI